MPWWIRLEPLPAPRFRFTPARFPATSFFINPKHKGYSYAIYYNIFSDYAGGAVFALGLINQWVGPPSPVTVRTGANMAGEQLRDSVPTNFEIERLATLVADLDATLGDP